MGIISVQLHTYRWIRSSDDVRVFTTATSPRNNRRASTGSPSLLLLPGQRPKAQSNKARQGCHALDHSTTTHSRAKSHQRKTHQKHLFQLSHLSIPEPAYSGLAYLIPSQREQTRQHHPPNNTPKHLFPYYFALRPACRCKPSRTAKMAVARTASAPNPTTLAPTATTDGAPEAQTAPSTPPPRAAHAQTSRPHRSTARSSSSSATVDAERLAF